MDNEKIIQILVLRYAAYLSTKSEEELISFLERIDASELKELENSLDNLSENPTHNSSEISN